VGRTLIGQQLGQHGQHGLIDYAAGKVAVVFGDRTLETGGRWCSPSLPA
jgi:hypothetical protein